MARQASAFIIAGLLCSPLGTAQAQTASDQAIEFKCPVPGTRVKIGSATEIIYNGRSELSCRYRQGDGQYLLFGGLHFRAPQTWSATGEKMAAAVKNLWPLKPGNTSEYSFSANSTDGRLSAWRFTYLVGNSQLVETPAGTFSTIVISVEQQGMLGNIFHSIKRFYYAPKEAMVVKFEVDHITGYDENAKNWQLTEYHAS